MTELKITGSVLSILEHNNVANLLVIDRDNPKNLVYKIPLWDSEAVKVSKNLDKGDEISVVGMVYNIGSNKYGNYIDVRQCKLISMAKIQRNVITTMESNAAEDSQPQKGEKHGK